MKQKRQQASRFEITGLIQGVGFRPFVYRLAVQHAITGWVRNTNKGVTAHVQGTPQAIAGFKRGLYTELPGAARIDGVEEHTVRATDVKGFSIKESRSLNSEVTDISPDIAVCDQCLADLRNQEHRLEYPFTNCTDCGPRFSIIKDVPYDRQNTTMAGFDMCGQCAAEYADITDRRFHAQPVACNRCGPSYTLHLPGRVVTAFPEILDETARRIDMGTIAAIKGIGGYQLVCDAFNAAALARLRKKKFREGKPFALMARDLAAIRRHCIVDEQEEHELLSWRRPIVLLKTKHGKIPPGKSGALPPTINPGLNTLGFLLPYMPFHYQLFEKLATDIIVFTSGNLSEEPIITDDNEALTALTGVAGMILTHDREIFSRCDDSVMVVAGGKPRLIRRSRGFVPGFRQIPFLADGILALGAEMLNAFCIGKDSKAILSQYNGDLRNMEVQSFYTENISHFTKLFRTVPRVIVHDLHPGYFSTKYAPELQRKLERNGGKVEILAVQHHHAHVASVMAEYGLDEKVIGVCFDGTGYGTDGHIWGGEFLVSDLAGFERYSHLEYVPLPGGDKAVEEPWRIALSFLFMAFGEKALQLPLPFNRNIPFTNRRFVVEMITKKLNSPLSSGAGRLFDAVSALLGLCLFSRFEAEAPMKLEAIIAPGCRKSYPLPSGDPVPTVELIRNIAEDIMKGEKPGIISAKFHNTLISLIFERSMEMARQTGIRKVVLSGGVFQNRYILEGLSKKFAGTAIDLYIPSDVPSNDGGIALGQLYIASKKLRKHVSRSPGKGHKH